MINEATYLIDKEMIRSIGLRPTRIPEGSQLATDARVFKFPILEHVYIMESDFYGNPARSHFLTL